MGRLKQKMILRQNVVGIWYLIPYTSRERFDELLKDIEIAFPNADRIYESCLIFDRVFDKNRMDDTNKLIITCYEMEK